MGLQRPQCWVLNTRLMFQTVRQDHAMPVCRCVRAHHSHTYEKTPIKRVRPFKGPNCCSKLHFEGQIHNTTGQPTSKNTFCDFRLRCSEDFSEKAFLLYILFHISELTSLGCMFAVTFWQLHLPGALPRKGTTGHAAGCNCSPCSGKTKGHGKKNW